MSLVPRVRKGSRGITGNGPPSTAHATAGVAIHTSSLRPFRESRPSPILSSIFHPFLENRMSLFDLADVVDLFLSWRFYLGLALTAAACLGVFQLVETDVLRWAFCTPIVVVGVFLSFQWQQRAESDR